MMPRSIVPPNKNLKCLGTTTDVSPLYATSRGMVANVGTMSLCLHLRSITSSMNPSSATKHIDSTAALYSINYTRLSHLYLTLDLLKSRSS